MNPSFRNLFTNKFTRERVVPSNLGECFLRELRQYAWANGVVPVPSEQQERARESLFARVEQLIDQILLDADVSGEHVGNETVGQRRLLVQPE